MCSHSYELNSYLAEPGFFLASSPTAQVARLIAIILPRMKSFSSTVKQDCFRKRVSIEACSYSLRVRSRSGEESIGDVSTLLAIRNKYSNVFLITGLDISLEC